MNIKREIKISGLLFLMIIFFWAPNKALAAESGDVGYNIQAIIPENQIDKEKSFFDLRMQPGQKQTIKLVINNTTDQDSEYNVHINQAYTNKQGFIDYSEPKLSPKNTYPYKLSEIAKADAKVSVAKNSSKEVPVTLTMPAEKFDGQILGAIQVVKAESKKSSGITNSYGYILGLKLTETDTEISRKLVLNKVKAAESFGKTSVVATIENPTMDAYGHLKYEAVIKNVKTNKEVRKVSYDNEMQMAPNSKYSFVIDWDNKRLEAGEYKLNLKVSDAKDNVWTFAENFKITAKEAKNINDTTIDAAAKNKIPLWLFVVVGILSAIIILAIIWIIILTRRKKEKDPQRK